MGLTDAERIDLRTRIAVTLARRSRSDADLTLDEFGFPTTADERHKPLYEGELEEYIVEALERGGDDDGRLENLDNDLHAGGLGDDMTDELAAELSIPGAPSTFLSVLTEGNHYLVFEETRDRIKAVRIYLDLLESIVEQATSLADPAEVYEAARLRRYPYLKRTPADFDDVVRTVLLATEFPLVAWGPIFIYCFSVLERFLADAVSIAARLRGRLAPPSVPNPKIESWIDTLESLGFKLMLPPQTTREIRILRPIRNRLTHKLSLVADDLPPELSQDMHFDGDSALPTPELARRALRAVHDVVGAAEVTFEMQASDAAVKRDGRSRRAE